MAPAAAPSLSDVENQVKEALKQANTITLNQITSRLNADPTVDLSELFKQQVDPYLAQAARQRSLELQQLFPSLLRPFLMPQRPS